MADIRRKNKWYNTMLLNRIPELQMEKDIKKLQRAQAIHRRYKQTEEDHLWQYLFENEKLLRNSLARFNLEDILCGKVPLTRKWSFQEKQEQLNLSEVTKQFINFKVYTTRRLFEDRFPKRPSYAALHANATVHQDTNEQSIQLLLTRVRHEAQKKTLLEFKRNELDLLWTSSSQFDKARARSQPVHSVTDSEAPQGTHSRRAERTDIPVFLKTPDYKKHNAQATLSKSMILPTLTSLTPPPMQRSETNLMPSRFKLPEITIV